MVENKKKSWWHTLPGILTAIGGVITAIATLITALSSTGYFDDKENIKEKTIKEILGK